MEVRFRDANPVNVKTDLLVIPVREKQLDDPAIRALDHGCPLLVPRNPLCSADSCGSTKTDLRNAQHLPRQKNP